jgi:hypothetical protein
MSDRGNVALPAASSSTPGFPSNFRPIVFEGFETLNVKSPRPAISDKECAWLDGIMPLAPSNARTLPDVGDTIYTGTGIVWLGYGNVGDQPMGFALEADGSLHGFFTNTAHNFTVLSAGTVTAPSSIFGMSQWGSQFMLFCCGQNNGYWVWDGTSVFTAGAADPNVVITDAGTNYTSAPDITFQTTGSGASVVATATVENQSVVKVVITNPGNSFGPTDFVVGTFANGGSDDQAIANVTVSPLGGVTEVIPVNPGSGYTSYSTVVFTGGGGSGAIAYPVIQAGAVTGVTIANTGTGYASPPTVTITDPGYGSGSAHVNGGTGFSGQSVVSFGQIIALNMVYGGSGYTSPPTIKILGDGAGFVATAQIQAGIVTGAIITNYGHGFTKALVKLEGGNNAANADFNIFPWDISGTAIETDQGRVWITNGAATTDTPPRNRTIFSDPDTPTGFGNGGGAFKSNDSFLRVGYHWLKQTNGFLYLGGDSSTNYISNVSTTTPSGSGVPVTNFSNQNVDPQVGSPWPSSVQVLSRNIVLANAQGIYVSYGGAMTKISTPIDPLYESCSNLTGSANWPAAIANIFNVQVYMLLINVFDAPFGASRNKLIMYDGKRLWTSQQSKDLAYIATQEFNSVLTAWGTDGTDVFPLFQNPSKLFTKTMISKLYAAGGIFLTKTMVRLQGANQGYIPDDDLKISIENETGSNAADYEISSAPVGSWGGTWTGAGDVVGTWTGFGLNIFGPIPVGQYGRMLGYTVQTDASDVALLSVLGEAQDYSTNA